MGDVSHVVPSIHPYLAIVGESEALCHQHRFADAGGKRSRAPTAFAAAKALARTAVEVLADESLRASMQEEWRAGVKIPGDGHRGHRPRRFAARRGADEDGPRSHPRSHPHPHPHRRPAAKRSRSAVGRRPRQGLDRTIGGQEVRQVPGAFGDPFRAIELCPASRRSSRAPVILRARRAARQRRLLPRRHPRPAPLPRRLGPVVIHPGLVERVDLYPGGYPARFGRFAGGIVSGETRRPPNGSRRGQRAPLRRGRARRDAVRRRPRHRPRWAAATRTRRRSSRSPLPRHVARLLGLPGARQVGARPTRTRRRLRVRQLRLLSATRRQRRRPFHDVLGTQFHRVDLRYDHDLPNGGNMRLAATVGATTGNNDHSGVATTCSRCAPRSTRRCTEEVRVRGRRGRRSSIATISRPGRGGGRAPPLPPARRRERRHVDRRSVEADAALDIVLGLRGASSTRTGSITRRSTCASASTSETGSIARSPSRRSRRSSRASPSRDGRSRRDVDLDVGLRTRGQLFVPVPGLQIGGLTAAPDQIQASQGIEVALPRAIAARRGS